MRWELTLEQARWEFAYTRTRLLQALGAAPDWALDESLYGRAYLRSTHDLDHAEQIRAWRKERGM